MDRFHQEKQNPHSSQQFAQKQSQQRIQNLDQVQVTETDKQRQLKALTKDAQSYSNATLDRLKNPKIVFVVIVVVCLVLVLLLFKGKTQEKSSIIGFNSDTIPQGKYLSQFFQFYHEEMKPNGQDHVFINGKYQPNLSYNKKRSLPTNLTQIKAPLLRHIYDINQHQNSLLQKDIDDKDVFGQQQIQRIKGQYHYNVANQGQQNVIFLLGDSHTKIVSDRLLQLYSQTKDRKNFPTIIALAKYIGVPFFLQQKFMDLFLRMVDKHKPKRIYVSFHWQTFYCWNHEQNCRFAEVQMAVKRLIHHLEIIKQKGIEVFVNGVDIDSDKYDPNGMIDGNKIVSEKLKPFKLSQERSRYERLYEIVESAYKQADIPIVNYSTNLCWQDTCHVVSPKGYTLNVDSHHPGRQTSRNWFKVYDFLTQF